MSAIKKILAFDVAQSFERGSKGHQLRRVVDEKGRVIDHLSESTWNAGAQAYLRIKEASLAQGLSQEQVPSAIQGSIGEMAGSVYMFLSDEFYPDLLQMIDQGLIGLETASRDEFVKAWREYDLPSRAGVFFQVLSANPVALRDSDGLVDFVSLIAAFSVLTRIDDAAIAGLLGDGRCLSDCIVDIERFRQYLAPNEAVFRAFDMAVKAAISDRSKQGGIAKNRNHNRARQFVAAEWLTHQAAYGNNKSAFARDYSRRVKNELDVSVTEKTIREVWLADTPTAGRPAG